MWLVLRSLSIQLGMRFVHFKNKVPKNDAPTILPIHRDIFRCTVIDLRQEEIHIFCCHWVTWCRQESFDLFSQQYHFYNLFFLNSLFWKTQLSSHRAADLGKVLQKVTSLFSLKSFLSLSSLKTSLTIARQQVISVCLYLRQTVGFFLTLPFLIVIFYLT